MPQLRPTPGSRFRNILLALLVLATSSLVSRSSSLAHAQTRGDFVIVQGSNLLFRGKPVKLKGTNFYPKSRPWAEMWRKWDGPATRADLARAQELGLNSVRVLVPYKPGNGWTNKETGEVVPEYLDELRQFVQMAGEMNMKVIVALFDFYDPADDTSMTPAMPTEERERRNKLYLQGIVPAFANDDRVLAWDLHNEPDLYRTWNDLRDPAASVAWMSRMAAEIRRLDTNHLLTVGMSDFQNVFTADLTGAPTEKEKAHGLTPADLSDFISFHSYNAGNMDWQMHYIRAHTGKPIVLQETGWPSGPPCSSPDYGEAQQQYLYGAMVAAARKGDLAGLMQWQLWDLPPGASLGGGRESHEDYFGLLRQDGTWKATMPIFRDGWPGALANPADPNSAGPTSAADPLPSVTKTDLPLTVVKTAPNPPDPNYQPPLYFPETGHYAYGVFRDYWRRFGGIGVFGYPLTEQRLEGTFWVQYFECARFEYHPENGKIKGFETLGKPDQYKLLILLTRLGANLVDAKTGGKGFPLPDLASVPAGATVFPETKHSLSGKIADYWWSHNGLTNFGFPLSEPVQERSQADGKTYTVQYFERTRLEYHPENAGTPYEIQLGLLGKELLASKGCR